MPVYGFVYMWINISNGKKYIGSHHGPEDDGYIGSGIYFRRAYDIQPDMFIRTILERNETCDDQLLTRALEQKYLDSVPNIVNRDDYYNLSSIAHGSNWSNGLTKNTHPSLMSLSNTMKYLHSTGKYKLAYKKTAAARKGKGADFYPKLKYSKERSLKISNYLIEAHKDGRREEIYKKISASKIGKNKQNDSGRKITSEKLTGNKNSAGRLNTPKNTIWITNGTICKMIKATDLDLYPTWRKGRK